MLKEPVFEQKMAQKHPVLDNFGGKILKGGRLDMFMSREVITSPQNKYVSLARGLTNKKNREKEQKFRFDGVKLMCEAFKKGVSVSFILASDKEWSSVLEKAEKLYGIKENDINCPVISVESTLFEKLSEEMAPA